MPLEFPRPLFEELVTYTMQLYAVYVQCVILSNGGFMPIIENKEIKTVVICSIYSCVHVQ